MVKLSLDTKHPLLLTKLYTGDPLGQVSVECAVAIKFIIILFNVVVCCCLSFPRCLRSSMRDTQYSHSQTKKFELVMACHALVEAVKQIDKLSLVARCKIMIEVQIIC